MVTITLKNVPDDVHAALKRQAVANKRSLNQEAIHCLDLVLRRRPVDTDSMLSEIRALRARSGVKKVELEWLDQAKRQGRP
jgi:plasmid stability protein